MSNTRQKNNNRKLEGYEVNGGAPSPDLAVSQALARGSQLLLESFDCISRRVILIETCTTPPTNIFIPPVLYRQTDGQRCVFVPMQALSSKRAQIRRPSA